MSDQHFVATLVNGNTYMLGPGHYLEFKYNVPRIVSAEIKERLEEITDDIPVKLGNQSGRIVKQQKFEILEFETHEEALDHVNAIVKPKKEKKALDEEEKKVLATIAAQADYGDFLEEEVTGRRHTTSEDAPQGVTVKPARAPGRPKKD